MAVMKKVGGNWRKVTGTYCKVSGTWRPVRASWVKVGGVWKQTYNTESTN